MEEQLDDIDRRLLFELDANARMPDTRLAHIVGKSKESVRYRLRKLRESGVLRGFHTYVDATRFGFEAHKIYLRTREKPKALQSFLTHVRARPDVFWMGMGDGAWNVGLTFFAQDTSAFFDDKNEIFSKFRDLVVEEKLGTVVQTYVLGKKFFCPHLPPPIPYRMMGRKQNLAVDSHDLAILDCMLDHGRMSYADIGARVKLPPDTVRRRVQGLEKNGIMPSQTISLDYHKIGYEYFKTFLYFEGLGPEQEKRLFDIARKHPYIIHYLKVLAPWDIELEIMAPNYHEYNQTINYLRQEFSDSLVEVETTMQDIDEVFPSGKVPRPTENPKDD